MLKIVFFITAFVLQEACSPMIILDLVPDPTHQLISDPDPNPDPER
jgi:hypothetical protein